MDDYCVVDLKSNKMISMMIFIIHDENIIQRWVNQLVRDHSKRFKEEKGNV